MEHTPDDPQELQSLKRGMYEQNWRQSTHHHELHLDSPATDGRLDRHSPFRIRLRRVLAGILGGFLTLWLLTACLRSIEARGLSMSPTVEPGDRLLINRLAYSQVDFGILDGLPLIDPGAHWRTPQRGDIIVFDSNVYRRILIKRVIGLPGEVLAIRDGLIYIDGVELDEPYAQGPTSCSGECRWTVPDDEYFVMGDNRPGSRDSREGWTVPMVEIIGERLIGY